MDLNGILRILINGKSIPKIVGNGPAKGILVNHTDRKVIGVKKDNFQLLVSVGEIIITIKYEERDLFLKKLENLLDNTLSFKYDIKVGIFTKTDINVSDYLKLGLGLEKNIDPHLIGMVDPNSKSKETVKLIGD